MTKFEISPREREDEHRRWEHEFGTTQLADEDERDLQLRRGGYGPVEDNA